MTAPEVGKLELLKNPLINIPLVPELEPIAIAIICIEEAVALALACVQPPLLLR